MLHNRKPDEPTEDESEVGKKGGTVEQNNTSEPLLLKYYFPFL